MKRYYKQNKWRLLLVGATHLLAAVSDVVRSFLLGSFIAVAMEGDLDRVIRFAVFTLAFLLLNAALDFLMRYPRHALIFRMGSQLRSDLMRKIEAMPWQEKEKKEEGYYLSLLNNDVSALESDYWLMIAMLFWLVCTTLLSLASALLLQPAVTLLVLGISLLSLLIPKATAKPIQKAKDAEQEARAGELTAISGLMKGFFLLKSFHRFDAAHQVYEKANRDLLEKKSNYRRVNALVYALSYGWGGLIFLGTWVLGLFFVTVGTLTLPALVTLANLMDSVGGSIQSMTDFYADVLSGQAVKKRILAFLDAPTEEDRAWGEDTLEPVAQLRLDRFTLSVADRVLLRDQSLTLSPGDRVALLGESGSGKSTLLRTLAAMQEGEGDYTLNGKPHRTYTQQSFRAQFTLMEQKSLVFDATVRDNVTLFEAHPDDAKVLDALRQAGLSKWLELRSEGLDTPIGGGRQGFSGGEERRLDLARVIYKGGSVVLLDEPTTGLDPETRQEVEKVIAALPCAILVVTVHDPSSEFLATFNRVLTLENGALREG